MNDPENKKQNVWDVIKSIACAIFGVQSQSKMQQDFTKGSIAAYVIGGVIAVVLLIGAIAMVVSYVTRGL